MNGISLILKIFPSANIDPSRRYLYLNVQGGKAFLEHLNEPDAIPGQKVSAYFTLHIYFRNQRFRSRPVACAVEPEFDEGFLLELHKEEAGKISLSIPCNCGNG